jgi:hypothetical protein
MLCAAVAPIVAAQLIEMPTVAARIGAVALGTIAFVPLMLVTARIIRRGDEFVRRVHLIAIAIAYSGALVLITLLDWLSRARFIDWVPLNVIWIGVALLWVFAVIGVNRYYARAQ